MGALTVAAVMVAIGVWVFQGDPGIDQIVPFECVDEQGIVARCDSNTLTFTVISVHEIPDQEGYPGTAYFDSFQARCPITTDFVFSPTRESWNAGDRQFLCVISR